MCILTDYTEFKRVYGVEYANTLFDLYFRFYTSCGDDDMKQFIAYKRILKS